MDAKNEIEMIRKRPWMYLGMRGLMGFLRYIDTAVSLHLAGKPNSLAFSIAGDEFTLESDAVIGVEEDEDGRILPFERLQLAKGLLSVYQIPIVTALAQSLIVQVASPTRQWSIEYREGRRVRLTLQEGTDNQTLARMSIVPDPSIFGPLPVPPNVIRSYVRRLSYLRPEVQFRFTIDNQIEHFAVKDGLRDLFEAFSAPFQICHEPIHVRASEEEAELELVFAFHNGRGNWLGTFVNKSWAIQGGSHEDGPEAGLKDFCLELQRRGRSYPIPNGVVGVMSLHYPKAQWVGCRGSMIGNPELVAIVERLVFTSSKQWLASHPQAASLLMDLCDFQFP